MDAFKARVMFSSLCKLRDFVIGGHMDLGVKCSWRALSPNKIAFISDTSCKFGEFSKPSLALIIC